MTRDEKREAIDGLASKIASSPFFYLTDSSSLNVETINKFRRLCFQRGVEFRVVKNTLLRKAMEQVGTGYEELFPTLKGSTSILIAEQGNTAARMLKEFRKESPKPLLKAAYIDSAIYIGDNQLDALTSIKSKNELIGELVGLLQSPARNVISALQSGGSTIAGIVKTLESRAA